MNRFVKDMLMSRYSDHSKSSPYAAHMGNDYGYDGARRDMRRSDRAYADYGYDRHYEYPVQHPDYRGYDMRRTRDYRDYGDGHQTEYGKMTREDIETWKKSLQNSDGTHGEHFRKEQIEQVARNMGINMSQFGNPDVFAMAVNMMYADYCAAAKKFGVDRLEYYVELAKAFLHDKDFKGEPEEKLWLYYKCIAEED